jgi:hypothetical protein
MATIQQGAISCAGKRTCLLAHTTLVRRICHLERIGRGIKLKNNRSK